MGRMIKVVIEKRLRFRKSVIWVLGVINHRSQRFVENHRDIRVTEII